MLNISILCIGTIKEGYLREAVKEYIKRLVPYAKIEIKELQEISFYSLEDRTRVLQKEADTINKNIKAHSTIFCLTEEGVQYTSPQFAQLLGNANAGNIGATHLTFIIGGALGLSNELKERADMLISFSKMTFTHQMVRVILLEQIYRAATILSNKKYHY